MMMNFSQSKDNRSLYFVWIPLFFGPSSPESTGKIKSQLAVWGPAKMLFPVAVLHLAPCLSPPRSVLGRGICHLIGKCRLRTFWAALRHAELGRGAKAVGPTHVSVLFCFHFLADLRKELKAEQLSKRPALKRNAATQVVDRRLEAQMRKSVS